jgi:hypothetical protein
LRQRDCADSLEPKIRPKIYEYDLHFRFSKLVEHMCGKWAVGSEVEKRASKNFFRVISNFGTTTGRKQEESVALFN